MRRALASFFAVSVALLYGQGGDAPGPTILSRGPGVLMQGGGELLRLRPYVALTGVYETGLAAPSVDASGKIPSIDDFGGRAEFGVSGYHNWRRTVLGLDYRGNVQHYRRQSYYDTTNHTLILGVTHNLSRQLAFTLREAAGTQSRDYGTFNGYAFFDSRYANVPANELFNGRTNYSSTMGDLTYAPGRRLSFNLGGSGMVVRRRSKLLIGMTGAVARGDVQYRLSRRVSIGADYGYMRYDFTRSFGGTDIHTVSADLAMQLGRSWNFAVRAGAGRVETLGLRTVAVDPVIAAITGRYSDYVVMYRKNYLPAFSAKLSRAFRRSTVSLDAETGTTPGNGVYLTSRASNAGVSFSHTASRRWNVGASAAYSRYVSLMQTMGNYRSYSAGGGVTFQVSQAFHIVARYDARRFEISQSAFGRRISHYASLGIAISPGDLPLSLW